MSNIRLRSATFSGVGIESNTLALQVIKKNSGPIFTVNVGSRPFVSITAPTQMGELSLDNIDVKEMSIGNPPNLFPEYRIIDIRQ